MQKLVVFSGITSQWQSLLLEAQSKCSVKLQDDLVCYLIAVLTRFTNKNDLAATVIATEYLESLQHFGNLRQYGLREIADKCLLLAGLFPGRAERKRVKISYFIHHGQNAYKILSLENYHGLSDLFKNLSNRFVDMVDVLHTIHELNDDTTPFLSAEQAEELWRDVRSKHSLTSLKKINSGKKVIYFKNFEKD